MLSTRTMQCQSLLGSACPSLSTSRRTSLPSRALRIKTSAKLGDQPGATGEGSRPEQGSFGKIEAPVRDTKPDGSQVNVEDRDTDNILRTPEMNRDTEWFGTEIGFLDGMRFYGAIPEVNNCRLSMLGFFLALIGEATTGRNVFQQVQANPLQTAAVFLTITLASTIPVLRGFPRKGNSIFSPDAEIINGRIAMLAFASIVLITAIRGSYIDIWPFFN